MVLKTRTPRLVPAVMRPFALGIGVAIVLAGGCAQRPTAAPPPAAAHVAPPDWFHRQLAAARAAKRAHQPATDTAGAQQAYDDSMRAACTRAALMGPDKYPARCDVVLHRKPTLEPADTDPSACEDSNEPTLQTACSE